MRGTWNVPITGVLLGFTVLLLVDPLFTDSNWWLPALLSMAVATMSAFLISHGVNAIPGASPRLVAGLTVALLLAATAGMEIPLYSRLDSALQSIVLTAAPFVLFRVAVSTVDMFTPSFTVSLLAGLSAMVLFAAGVPLLVLGNPSLSLWACMGFAAAIAYVEGIAIGAALRPLFPT